MAPSTRGPGIVGSGRVCISNSSPLARRTTRPTGAHRRVGEPNAICVARDRSPRSSRHTGNGCVTSRAVYLTNFERSGRRAANFTRPPALVVHGNRVAAVARLRVRLPVERAPWGRRSRVGGKRRRVTADAARRSLGDDARQFGAVVGGDRAGPARHAAGRLAGQLAARARDAMAAVAAVHVVGGRAASADARADPVAAGDAELVEFARPRVALRPAAVVARRRDRASIARPRPAALIEDSAVLAPAGWSRGLPLRPKRRPLQGRQT